MLASTVSSTNCNAELLSSYQLANVNATQSDGFVVPSIVNGKVVKPDLHILDTNLFSFAHSEQFY
jgi:hypothetical protein